MKFKLNFDFQIQTVFNKIYVFKATFLSFSILLFATFLFINTLRVAPESVIWKIYLPKLSLFLCRFISQPLLGLLSAMHFKVVDLNSTKFVCVNFNMWIESGLIWESLHAGRECKFIEIYANLIILVVRVKKGSSNSLIALWANGSFIINDSGRQTTLEIRKSHYKLMNLINNLLSLTFHFRSFIHYWLTNENCDTMDYISQYWAVSRFNVCNICWPNSTKC